MRKLLSILLAILMASVLMYVLAGNTSASVPFIDEPETFSEMDIDQHWSVEVTLWLHADDPIPRTTAYYVGLVLPDGTTSTTTRMELTREPWDGAIWHATQSVGLTMHRTTLQACVDGNGILDVYTYVVTTDVANYPGDAGVAEILATQGAHDDRTIQMPCSVLWWPIIEPPVAGIPVCGDNNDELPTVPQQSDSSLGYEISGWSDNAATVTFFSTDPLYVYTHYAQTVFTIYDDGDCVADAFELPHLINQCGIENDQILFNEASLPTGVSVDTGAGWVDNVFTYVFTALPGYILNDQTPPLVHLTDPGLCVVEGLQPPRHEPVCGVDNDVVAMPDSPEEVLIASSDGWSADHTWTVTYSIADPSSHRFPDNFQTEYLFTDEGPCIVVPIPPEVAFAECGTGNDVIPDLALQEGVLVIDTLWQGNHRTITLSPDVDNGYAFPPGTTTEFKYEDSGLCSTEIFDLPYLVHECGIENDRVVSPEDLPEGVRSESDGLWTNGVYTIRYFAEEGFILHPGTPTELNLTDPGLCQVEGLSPPIHDAVCGTDNDVVTVPNVPDGQAAVSISSSGTWSDNHTWNVVYTVGNDDQFRLPDGMEAEYVFIDTGPCIVDPVAPAPATATCGAGNDVIPPLAAQEGVLVSDTQWIGNQRLITLAPDVENGYEFPPDATTSFEYVDENIPCEEGNTGGIVIVELETSDDRSLEGLPYELYPSNDSQVDSAPYADGVVGQNNEIHLGALPAGTWRIVVSPESGDSHEAQLVVMDGTDSQTVAITIEEGEFSPEASSPSQSPTAVDNTSNPTTSSVQSDSDTNQTVTSLPDTGIGGEDRCLPLHLAMILAVSGVFISCGLRHRYYQ